MRKKLNIFLILGSIISLVFALKYSSLPVLNFLPRDVADFFITTPEVQQQFVLVYDLAVGFVLSVLFYCRCYTRMDKNNKGKKNFGCKG